MAEISPSTLRAHVAQRLRKDILAGKYKPGDRLNESSIAREFKISRIPVREAEDKEPISGGTVYFAPPDYHLLVEVDRSLSLSSDEPVLFSRPSIDVLFESAADAYGSALIAIILLLGVKAKPMKKVV